MKVAIASGKGGTGKTTVATNLALSLSADRQVMILDSDVEEPNSHIFFDMKLTKMKDVSIPLPEIDNTMCDLCGKCADFCRYNALAVTKKSVMVFSELCHGCGGCMLVCPQNAIGERYKAIGRIEGGEEGNLTLCHGLLNVGEAMATPVVRELKKVTYEGDEIIIDAPPGAGCPVIESLRGSDYCILVAEPTPFGLYDLKIAVSVTRVLDVPFGVVINRDGMGNTDVEDYCKQEGIPVLMKIPHDEEIAIMYSKGTPFVNELPEWKEKFLRMYEQIERGNSV